VTLELTESRWMKAVRAPPDILTRLRRKRIRLSIENFGTGHSSLAQVRDISTAPRRPDDCRIANAATGA